MRQSLIASMLVGWLAATAAAGPLPGGVYRVDAAVSDVHWRIYRAGAFSGLGHNHVIAAGELLGTVRWDGAGTGSFELTIPVSGLVVDDPELRARYGEDFDSEPSAKDIAGTRRNMLGRKVLDADDHPLIRVAGTLTGVDPCALAVRVELRGRGAEFTLPCRLEPQDEGLTASGEFSLSHEDLGLKRFKVMLGTLAVAERIDFSYRVRAVREPAVETGTTAQ